jgi:hypothetical protein
MEGSNTGAFFILFDLDKDPTIEPLRLEERSASGHCMEVSGNCSIMAGVIDPEFFRST